MKKKLYATILSLCLLVAAFPVSVFADESVTVTEDGSVNTTLNYQHEEMPHSDTFSVLIPTSLSWGSGATSFEVSLTSDITNPNFAVNVFLDPSSLETVDNVDVIKLYSTTDNSYYCTFDMQVNFSKAVTKEDNRVTQFTSVSEKTAYVGLTPWVENPNPDNLNYSGSITFNISSEYF